MGITIGGAAREAGLLEALVIEPPTGADVCRRCRGWTRPGLDVCFPCRLVEAQVAHPCPRVAVASIYRRGSALHETLRHYKDGTGRRRQVLARRVGAWASTFLWRRGPLLAPDGWDGVVVVPSSAGRPGPHPLEAALAQVEWLAPQLMVGLVTAGSRPCGHRQAGEEAFRVTGAVGGARLLVVDDTWASGARAQSAASALAGAGAEVVGVAVLGRIVTPRPGTPSEAWWERHGRGRGRRCPPGLSGRG